MIDVLNADTLRNAHNPLQHPEQMFRRRLAIPELALTMYKVGMYRSLRYPYVRPHVAHSVAQTRRPSIRKTPKPNSVGGP